MAGQNLVTPLDEDNLIGKQSDDVMFGHLTMNNRALFLDNSTLTLPFGFRCDSLIQDANGDRLFTDYSHSQSFPYITGAPPSGDEPAVLSMIVGVSPAGAINNAFVPDFDAKAEDFEGAWNIPAQIFARKRGFQITVQVTDPKSIFNFTVQGMVTFTGF